MTPSHQIIIDAGRALRAKVLSISDDLEFYQFRREMFEQHRISVIDLGRIAGIATNHIMGRNSAATAAAIRSHGITTPTPEMVADGKQYAGKALTVAEHGDPDAPDDLDAWWLENCPPEYRVFLLERYINAPVDPDWRLKMNTKPTGPLGILGPKNPEPGALLVGRANGIEDADGFDWKSGTWQWLRDGVEIPGATASTYRVTEADKGAGITVRFSFTDFGGTDEEVISDPRQVPDEDIQAVTVFYLWGLRREPDEAGLDFWVDRLDDILANEEPDRILAMCQLMLEFTQGAGYADEAAVQGR